VTTPPESVYPAEPISSSTVVPAIQPSEAALTVNPDNPTWGVPTATICWAISVALLFVVPNVCVLPYIAYRYRDVEITQATLLADKTFVFLYVLGWLPTHLLTLALIWGVATRLGKYSIWEVFGWTWGSKFNAKTSVMLALILFVVAWGLTVFFGGQKTDLDRILESSRATALLVAFIAVATAPLVEELIYRGLLYSAIQRLVGAWPAVFLVAAMFAGLHVYQYWPNFAAISSITLLSLVLTAIRARTGRLLPCFVIHLVFNGVQSFLIVIEPYLRAYIERAQPKPQQPALTYLVRLIAGL
jgi:uncharacterized protein